ncbi:MAG: hypothetical protein ACQKBU_00180 [Verrucomicrobiales bacterium]
MLISGMGWGSFVPPEEGPIPFRRDKLPIDVSTMTSLSSQLVSIAGELDRSQPAGRRAVAQALALSLALDPSKNRVRRLIEGLESDQGLPRAPEEEVQLALSRAWDLLGWLEEPEAGVDGRALGKCLADILCYADPGHPVSEAIGGKGERGAWKDWVAPVARFEKTKEPELKMTEALNGEEKEEEATSSGAAIVLKRVSCHMPLRWRNEKTEELKVEPVEFHLTARVDPNQRETLKVHLPSGDLSKVQGLSNASLSAFLESRHGSLPKGLQLTLEEPKQGKLYYARDGRSLAGLVAVMADAVFSGVPPEGAVYAGVGSEGELETPYQFWEILRRMGQGSSHGRLVIPYRDRDQLLPMLTLGEAEFFFQYEVFLAKDLEELIALSSSEPAENVRSARAIFQQVKEAKGTRSLGSFVTHSATQQRLAEVYTECPEHASARMLALRGTANWPKRLEREFYAKEVRAALEPMRALLAKSWYDEVKPKAVTEVEDLCRERLGEIEKLYGSVADRTELHDRALNTTQSLSGLASSMKRNSDEAWNHKYRIRPVYLEMIDTLELLTRVAGDQKDYPLPPRDREQ